LLWKGSPSGIDRQKSGRLVREIRKKQKLTQAQLAEKVRLSVKMIGYVERGERFPSPETFEKQPSSLAYDFFRFVH
jgi:transcriptional regulator with XRE-family HTH domain